MPFLILFIMIPIAEVYAFIAVGEEIGVLQTLLLCVLTAALGGFLVRQQGLETLMKAQKSFTTGILPIEALFDGLCLIIAGALLLTPGFVTDIAGFSLLLPPFRSILRKIAAKSGKFSQKSSDFQSKHTKNSDDVIEGVYKDVSNDHEKLDK